MTRTRCAILASGRSTRMGSPKFALVYEGRTFLDRALDAASGFDPIVVAPSASIAEVRAACAGRAAVVANGEPERGMTHALRLALAAVRAAGEPERPIALAVLPVDLPLLDAALVERVVSARGDADVAFPQRRGRPGHPVVFGPRPLAVLSALPDGDTLRALRDDLRFSRVAVPVDDDRPFRDIDTPEALAALRDGFPLSDGSG